MRSNNINKKAAMFGLEGRELRKESGRLFLASLRKLTFRLVVGQQASGVKTQKAAMFGLDARIALAIFGALSVISGASLYSAIQEAETVAYMVTVKEIEKAMEAYYLDTRRPLPNVDASSHMKIGNLIQNDAGFRGWSGPYLPYTYNSETALDLSIQGTDYVLRSYRDTSCSSNCSISLFIGPYVSGDGKGIFEMIDEKYDDGDKSTGKITYLDYAERGQVEGINFKINPE